MTAAAALCAAVLAAPVPAQDFNLNPTFGTITLVAGFTPDPRTIDVTAGGNINAGAWAATARAASPTRPMCG
jgi:serine protease Do/protease YdgD